MTSGQEQVRHSQGLQDSQCSGGPALFVLSGSVPQPLTVISPSPAGTKGEYRKEAPPGNVTALLWDASAAFGTICRIQLTAQIEVFLFGKGNGGRRRAENGLHLPQRRPPGGQTPAASFFGSKLPAGTGKYPFIDWGGGGYTSRLGEFSSQNFERKQHGTEKNGQEGEA